MRGRGNPLYLYRMHLREYLGINISLKGLQCQTRGTAERNIASHSFNKYRNGKGIR